MTDIMDEQGRTFLNYAICCAANNSFEVSYCTYTSALWSIYHGHMAML